MSEESEALKEGAKAAQEIAKTAGQAIDAGRQAGVGWIEFSAERSKTPLGGFGLTA